MQFLKSLKFFNTLLEWEIWFYYNIVKILFPNKDRPNAIDFYQEYEIHTEMIKKGYDGIIIKGREMVNYKPNEDEINYFKDEEHLIGYYKTTILK